MKKELLELAQSSLVGLPNLIRTAQVSNELQHLLLYCIVECLLTNVYVLQMKIEAITKDKEAAAESMLRTQFKMEMIVYTQDSTYGKKLGKRKREEEQPAASSFAFQMIVNSSNSGATLKEMIKHLKSYYQVSDIQC